MLLWVEHGVRIFRVDNPHTKPPNFWHWLIWQVKAKHPDVLFLAEAFTRPARMFGLARLGFTQTYTYFTWRTGKQELTEFALMHAERAGRVPAEPVRQHPGHPARVAADRRPVDVRDPGHAGRHDVARPGACTPGFELYEGSRSRPGSEEYQQLREVRSCARATSPAR